MAKITLLPNHKFISTITDDEQNTHQHVKQEYLITPHADVLPLASRLISDLIVQGDRDGKPQKLIVFLPTAREVGIAHDLVRKFDEGPFAYP